MQVTSDEDQQQMIIHKMGAAAGLISVFLQSNPLSQPSKPEPASHVTQAVPNSPLARATQGGSAAAAPSSETEPASPPDEAARDSPVDPAQTSAPSCGPPPTAIAWPVSLATAAKLSTSRPDEQGSSDCVHDESLDVNETHAGTLTTWQTPTAATWKQISTISVRAMQALHWLSQLPANCKGQTEDTSPLGWALILMSADLLTKLRELLRQLLWGHFSDVTLDFQPILQAGLAPIVRLLQRDEGYDRNVGLVVRCLERMTKDSMQGRVKAPANEEVLVEQIRSVYTLLGKLNLDRR